MNIRHESHSLSIFLDTLGFGVVYLRAVFGNESQEDKLLAWISKEHRV